MSLVADAYGSDESEDESMDVDEVDQSRPPQETKECKDQKEYEAKIENKIENNQPNVKIPDHTDGKHAKINLETWSGSPINIQDSSNTSTAFIDNDEGELEDIVKPKTTQITDVVKPERRAKQPVRISIPALFKDEEDGKPSSKKPKLSSTKCGLFDLLPAPQNLTIKEAGRILIPHSLMKKPVTQTVAKNIKSSVLKTDGCKSRNPLNLVECDYSSDSDSDGEEHFFSSAKNVDNSGDDNEQAIVKANEIISVTNEAKTVNFFSLESDYDDKHNTEETTSKSYDIVNEPSNVSDSRSDRLLCTNVYSLPISDSEDYKIGSVNLQTSKVSEKTRDTANFSLADIPLPTNTLSLPPNTVPLPTNAFPLPINAVLLPTNPTPAQPDMADLPLQFAGQSGSVGNPWKVSSSPFGNYSAYSAVSKMYSTLHPEQHKVEDVATVQDQPSAEVSVHGPMLEQHEYNDEMEFMKIQGRRGRLKEEVNIIDVDCNDITGPVDFTKGLSEEVSEGRKKLKKDDGPTSQQRKKHQITYLAFQAKERELDLKNQWSQNRMTKRQTQAKYGF